MRHDLIVLVSSACIGASGYCIMHATGNRHLAWAGMLALLSMFLAIGAQRY